MHNEISPGSGISLLEKYALIVFSVLIIIASLTMERLSSSAMLSLSLIAVLIFIRKRYQPLRPLAIGCEILLVMSCLALLIHFLPGFNNLKLLDKVSVGPYSTPFSMCLNLDKPLIPIILLSCLPTMLCAPAPWRTNRTRWLLLVISIPSLLLLATLVGGLYPEFHLPTWLWQFVIVNLFFVCLAEEALFRGYLQQRLTQWIGALPALLLASLLFGLAHIPGGWQFVLFATLAGIIYGVAWNWSGKLWVAVIFHFSLNLLHLLLFTYPARQADLPF